MNILIPVVIVVVIGLVAGVILTIASKLMYVPIDQLVADIREELPGANCGACGFAGCDDYASALGKDKGETLSPSMCPVGGPDLAAKLAELLGVEATAADPKVATVLCGGNAAAAKKLMDYEGIDTCKAASQFYGGQWACGYGCLGLGDCAAACDYGAICVADGLAVVDREKCVGCGMCTKACPKNLIEVHSKKDLIYVACKSKAAGAQTRKSCSAGCIGCRKCEKACRFDAIVIENNLARVDFEKCKNCGLCAKECPTGAIVNLRPKKQIPAKNAAAEA